MSKETFTVASIAPFWRFAVVPERQDTYTPGIPFYRYAAAKAFFEEARTALPWASVYLIRKPWYGKAVDVVERYEGQPTAFPQ